MDSTGWSAGATHLVRVQLGASHTDLPAAKFQDENGRHDIHDGKRDRGYRQEEIDQRGEPARTPIDSIRTIIDHTAVTASCLCSANGKVSVRVTSDHLALTLLSSFPFVPTTEWDPLSHHSDNKGQCTQDCKQYDEWTGMITTIYY